MAGGSPCASCKLLRRRCTKDCIFAPFFPADDPHKFAIVHKVFGASNVSKMLLVRTTYVASFDDTSCNDAGMHADPNIRDAIIRRSCRCSSAGTR